MSQPFIDILSQDGKKNSIGGVEEVIQLALSNNARIEELYQVMFCNDPWTRMRAADAFEKICRIHPELIEPYINRIQKDLAKSNQPSIQWHIAQIYGELDLTKQQKEQAVDWLIQLLSTPAVDWIVASNSMKTLAIFAAYDDALKSEFRKLLKIQERHKSNAVVKQAKKLMAQID